MTHSGAGSRAFRLRGLAPALSFPLALVAAHLSASGVAPAASSGVTATLRITGLVAVIAGLAVRAAVIAHVPHQTSGRGSRLAARVLNSDGLYSLVRHPLYTGNILVWIGVAAFSGAWWLPPLQAILVALSLRPVIRAEDAFLAERFGEAHRSWAARTPALVPSEFGGARPPELRFSARTVLRRESTTWWAAAVALALIAAVRTHAEAGAWTMPRTETAALAAVTALWIGVHALKYGTRILHVPGR